MRLDELIKDIKDTSLKHVLVNEFGEGDIYEYLNSGEHKYPCVFLTITGLSDADYTRNVNITLFYVDRLTSDKKNRTQVQSEATNVLGDIIHEFESTNVNYTLFTEKFSDLCAGAYAEFNVTVEYTAGCEQNFIVRTKKIENNGIYNVDGFDSVDVDVKGKMTLKNGTKLAYSTWAQIPEEYDLSNITDFSSMFYSCKNLTEIPPLNTSKCTNFRTMFYNCYNLTEIPQIDTSKGTDFGFMFQYCYNLTEIPQIDTSKGTNFQQMFYECNNLVTIPLLDLSNKEPVNYYGNDAEFANCGNLENITFAGRINSSIAFSTCPKLTYESVKSILTACSKTTKTTTSKTVWFKQTLIDQNGELAALIATCNSKKWTISGLTLQ